MSNTLSTHLRFRPVYKRFRVFGFTTPIGTRQNYTCQCGEVMLSLDLHGKRVMESTVSGKILLANTSLQKARKWHNSDYGWIGGVELKDGSRISLELDELDGTLVTIHLQNSRPRRIRVGYERSFSIDLEFLLISVDMNRSYWNPEKNARVDIHCAEEALTVAKVLGVLVFSLLFDCYLDGSHS